MKNCRDNWRRYLTRLRRAPNRMIRNQLSSKRTSNNISFLSMTTTTLLISQICQTSTLLNLSSKVLKSSIKMPKFLPQLKILIKISIIISNKFRNTISRKFRVKKYILRTSLPNKITSRT